MSECLNCKVYVEVKISPTLDTLTAEPYKDAYSPTTSKSSGVGRVMLSMSILMSAGSRNTLNGSFCSTPNSSSKLSGLTGYILSLLTTQPISQSATDNWPIETCREFSLILQYI